MTVNPGALLLLVVGFVAVVVGVRGTQRKAGQLLTGKGIPPAAAAAGHKPPTSGTLPPSGPFSQAFPDAVAT